MLVDGNRMSTHPTLQSIIVLFAGIALWGFFAFTTSYGAASCIAPGRFWTDSSPGTLGLAAAFALTTGLAAVWSGVELLLARGAPRATKLHLLANIVAGAIILVVIARLVAMTEIIDYQRTPNDWNATRDDGSIPGELWGKSLRRDACVAQIFLEGVWEVANNAPEAHPFPFEQLVFSRNGSLEVVPPRSVLSGWFYWKPYCSGDQPNPEGCIIVDLYDTDDFGDPLYLFVEFRVVQGSHSLLVLETNDMLSDIGRRNYAITLTRAAKQNESAPIE